MTVRPAQLSDIEAIMPIFDRARAFMRSVGNEAQWTGGYPARDLIISAIDAGKQYVCTQEGEVVGTFYFAVEEEPTYAQITDGEWLNDAPYGVVHRLASSGQCKGVGRRCLEWCLEQAGNIRIDTHRCNAVMLNILRKAGYTRCGVIFIADGTPREAFQKCVTCR
ncbi:MAG: GNAT family N-acetyltransferase [Rikenellaceae bacterium]|jgi:GNAT superfamily N-acetyltransferase|nr:GNAT family N-acetyltransferase [Rikenellaceae bacterium]